MVISYIAYFSVFTILRSQNLYAHYYDLGIMHQTVFNTYEAIRTGDLSRFLEMTNTQGTNQIKRMAIHNDIILAMIAPLYYIFSGPETLLVIQTIILGFGAFAVFGIVQQIFIKNKWKNRMGLLFAFSYLMYTPMQRANIFDFHAVVLSTSFLLFMFYFWLKRNVWLSIIFLCLSLLTKEQVGLTTFFFGGYILLKNIKLTTVNPTKVGFILEGIHTQIDSGLRRNDRTILFPLLVMGLSLAWFLISMLFIIPSSRGSGHFALTYYSDFGESPVKILTGLIQNPANFNKYIFHIDTARYFFFLLGPLGFMSLFSPLTLLIALPEFAINLLSNSWNMRNIVFHYTSVIQPFIFISSVYGAKNVLDYFSKLKKKRYLYHIFFVCLFVFCLLFSYFKGPLPFSKEADLYPLIKVNEAKNEVIDWSKRLKNPDLKIASTGSLASYFTSRRYYYHFPGGYEKADYVIVKKSELYNYFDPKVDIMGVYRKLQKDTNYRMIYQSNQIEVYSKI